MARFKPKRITYKRCTFTLKRKPSTDEFVVQTFVGGKLVGGKDGGYFTDDLADARATLAVTIKRVRREGRCGR